MLNIFLLLLSIGVSGGGTFSIAAVDTATAEFGIAVASRVLDVGYIVPWIEPAIGAVATQALANPYLGRWALEEMEKGKTADEVLKIIIDRDSTPEERQVGIVDAKGNAAAFTGKNTLSWAGHRTEAGVSIQGNILAGPEVINCMFEKFQKTEGPLAERLLAALEAGEAAGGDRRGKQSAALYVWRKRGGYQGANDQLVILKVVDNPEPVKELRREYELWQYAFLAPAYIRLATEEQDRTSIFLDRAHALLVKALNSNMDNAEVYNSLAWEFALRKVYPEEVITAAERAHKLDPDDPNIMDTLAEAYYAAGDYKKAIHWERSALKIEPNNKFFQKQLERFKKRK